MVKCNAINQYQPLTFERNIPEIWEWIKMSAWKKNHNDCVETMGKKTIQIFYSNCSPFLQLNIISSQNY